MIISTLFYFIFGTTLRHKNKQTSLPCTSYDNAIGTSPFGLRIDARTLSKEQFQQYFDGKWPVILTNVFDVINEKWTNELLSSLGEKDIEYDVRHSSSGDIDSYEATLNEFVSSLSDNSDHEENMYLMNEDLLRNETKLKDFMRDSVSLFGEDLFQYFPKDIRPYQALIIGGVGARSFLHSDPYEWMGTNYLLEGKKLWTFFTPDVPASLFGARRNAPDAWGDYNISAGWVSDLDLYKYKQKIVLGALANNEMRQLDKKEGSVSKSKDKSGGLEKLTCSTLTNKWLQTAISDEDTSTNAENNLAIPIFLSGVDEVDYCKDPRLAAGAMQLIQEEGDLIIIPPYFWHQVYHLEPSIAVASQYVNDVGKERVFNHILKWCSSKVSEEHDKSDAPSGQYPFEAGFELMSEKEQVLSVIKTGLKLQHGRLKGPALMRKLLSNKD
jgi:hypothetical protein